MFAGAFFACARHAVPVDEPTPMHSFLSNGHLTLPTLLRSER